jgi:hypothetical protein
MIMNYEQLRFRGLYSGCLLKSLRKTRKYSFRIAVTWSELEKVLTHRFVLTRYKYYAFYFFVTDYKKLLHQPVSTLPCFS